MAERQEGRQNGRTAERGLVFGPLLPCCLAALLPCRPSIKIIWANADEESAIPLLCEVCGRQTSMLRVVLIEGSELNACPDCARFGVERAPKPKASTAPVHISEAIERREKRSLTRDVLSDGTEELVSDFHVRIRRAREKLLWSPEDLGRKINEKKSVILKLEGGQMRPDDSLIRKLERTLNIKLRERPTMASAPKSAVQRGLTLGDLIRIEKK
ncbi:MAG: TIGR00270 family protein [Euryarchaeota archaeon]|nr:TIGR00270 family protein [Euryarchaeota archaeon]